MARREVEAARVRHGTWHELLTATQKQDGRANRVDSAPRRHFSNPPFGAHPSSALVYTPSWQVAVSGWYLLRDRALRELAEREVEEQRLHRVGVVLRAGGNRDASIQKLIATDLAMSTWLHCPASIVRNRSRSRVQAWVQIGLLAWHPRQAARQGALKCALEAQASAEVQNVRHARQHSLSREAWGATPDTTQILFIAVRNRLRIWADKLALRNHKGQVASLLRVVSWAYHARCIANIRLFASHFALRAS